jgi:tripartite-type tricarboxylate transporter receptor subunit TctC
MKNWSIGAILTIAIAAAMIVPGRAQNYPSGPVTLVIGNPAGGAGDIIAGVISEKLAKALGQPVNIESLRRERRHWRQEGRARSA